MAAAAGSELPAESLEPGGGVRQGGAGHGSPEGGARVGAGAEEHRGRRQRGVAAQRHLLGGGEPSQPKAATNLRMFLFVSTISSALANRPTCR